MAFPDYATIIQTFTAADATTPPPTESGVAWANKLNSANNNLTIISNRGYSVTAGATASAYTSITYGPDVEGFGTIATRDNTVTGYSINLIGRVQNPGTSTPSGYGGVFGATSSTGSAISIWKLSSGTWSQLGTTVDAAWVVADGDKVGIRIFGQGTVTVEVFHKPGAGAWVYKGARTDSSSPITAAGPAALWIENNVYRLDDVAFATMATPGSWASEELMFPHRSRSVMPMISGPHTESLFQISDAIGR